MNKGSYLKYKPGRLQKPVRFYFVIIAICFWNIAHAQYERLFNDPSTQYALLLTETYDESLLIEELDDSFLTQTYLVKYTLEGKELCRIQFRNIYELSALATKDSGFIVAANYYPKSTNPDNSFGSIAILKFDKCCKMQWAKYVPGNGGLPSVSNHSIIEDNRNFYILGYGIATMDQSHRLPITVLKFSEHGDLINYKFLPGDNALIYKNQNDDTLYIAQEIYIPLAGDTNFNVYYLYSGIHAIDTGLNDLGQALPGYPGILNDIGSLMVNNTSVQAITTSVQTSTAKTMLTNWSKSLVPIRKRPYYDSLANYNLGVVDASALNDSIVVISNARKEPGIPSYFYITLRLYNDTLKLLKQYNINKGNQGQTAPSSFLRLKNGNIIVSSLNYSDTSPLASPLPINSSFYLFDRKLNPLIWPTTPPAKGYDWACSKAIPPTQVIYLDSIVQPVNIVPDDSFVDWQKLIKSIKNGGIPENATKGRIENGWLSYPQPLKNNSALYFKSLSNNVIQDFGSLDVVFYDIQGKQVLETTAIYQSAGKWVIPSVNLPSAGAYMAELLNKRSGVSEGKVKIVMD